MTETTDVLYLNKNEKVNVTICKNSILIKNEKIDININCNKIFNYNIEKKCISLYLHSSYYEKVKEIIKDKKEYSNNYIVVKLYYKETTNKIFKHIKKLIQDNYQNELEDGYLFAGNSYNYEFDLKCGFKDKKNSKVRVTYHITTYEFALSENDYFNRLKKSSFVPQCFSISWLNIVSAELKENCLTIIVYFDEYYPFDERMDAEFYAEPTDKKYFLKIELSGDENKLSELKRIVEKHICFVSPQVFEQKREEDKQREERWEEASRKEAKRTSEELRKRLDKYEKDMRKRGINAYGAILRVISWIVFFLSIPMESAFLSTLAIIMWIISLILVSYGDFW